MKRWRCPECGSIHTARPAGYAPGCNYPQHVQRRSILHVLETGSCLKTVSRHIQQYWLRTFKRNCQARENIHDNDRFLQLARQPGRIAATKCLAYREIPLANGPPYLLFALTTAPYRGTLE